jgi:hypothetical protein
MVSIEGFVLCCIDKYFIGNCFGLDGIDEIRNILENKNFINQMAFR